MRITFVIMWDGISADAMALISSPWEFWGAVTGFLCVWLAARENIWNWPVAIISTICYIKVFFDSKLYSDSFLQIIFIGSQLYGLFMWLKKKNNENLKIKKTGKKHIEWIVIVLFLFSTIWYFCLIQIKPDASMPMLDSVTTSLSLLALILQAKKIIDSWWVWIIADVIYIPMYLNKNLYLTAILYLLFLALAAYGLKSWNNKLKKRAFLYSPEL